jgi:hypothetical protein
MSKVLTRTDMDKMMTQGCQAPGCTCSGGPLAMAQRCHPGAGVDAFYHEDGTLHIECHECESPVAVVAIAKEEK